MVVFKIVLETEPEGGFVARVPALPGCFSRGETRLAAMESARKAIAAYLEELHARGDEVPSGLN